MYFSKLITNISIIKTMRIEQSILEKIYGKMICAQPINFNKKLFDDNKSKTIDFEIYDGFAYCPDFKGSEYCMTYPKVEFINSCKEMQTAVRDFMGLHDDEKVTATDILQSYCDLIKIEDNGDNLTIVSVTEPQEAAVEICC